MDVSLRDINVGMPVTKGDMYALEEQALYLIKVRYEICVMCWHLRIGVDEGYSGD